MCKVIFRHCDSRKRGWIAGRGFAGLIEARRPEDVADALAQADAAAQKGLWAAGFVAYEAAAGLDEHLAVHRAADLPLVWLALFEGLAPSPDLPGGAEEFRIGPWEPSVSLEDYQRVILAIKEWIASGDTYQVNYTIRLRSAFRGSPEALFARLWQAQGADCCAFIDTGRWAICSASPELFFQLDGDEVVCRPMKGTARRGLWPEQDRQRHRELSCSAKDRAENAMIVDMVRNDVGRIAQSRSVRVRQVFAIEKYPTVYQMTSTVACRTEATLPGLFRAMFPCASVTGPPKVRTMQIIRELEPQPRGVYTGAIGYWGPGRRGRFNVAIRTVVIDKPAGRAEYGVGGGIVWDSQGQAEYAECQAKASVLTAQRPEFELLETLRYDGAGGYFLLEEHLRRLAQSAEYFDFAVDIPAVRRRLADLAAGLIAPARVRLRVGKQGQAHLETAPAPAWNRPEPWRLKLADHPVAPEDPFLYHKTTQRRVYDEAFERRGDCDDVLLWNDRGELTETTRANIVLELDGQRVTPPVSCGLLGGVMRASLLASGQVTERVCTLGDLARCRGVHAINSVRGWMKVSLAFCHE